MKKIFLAIAIIYVVTLPFASCKKPVSQLALYVPKDASAVFVVDTKAIMDKIASSGITIDSLANLFTKKNDTYALRWNDIKNSGIDLSHPFYFFSKQTNSIQEGNIKSAGLIAQVEDAKKLEVFFKKQKVGSDVLSGGKYQYIALGDDYVAGWTDRILIISAVTGGNNSPGKYSTGEGTLSQLQLTTLFTQKESASIASLGEFRDILAKTGDIHFYANTSASLSAIPLAGMSKLNSLLEGSFTEGVINFEKGKIEATSESHYNKTFSDILNKYPSKSIDKDMIKNYPEPLAGFGVIAFNPKVLVDVLHYLGFDMMADGFTSSMGFTTNDVVNAFSGDIAVMFSPGSGKMPGQIAPEYETQTIHHNNFLVNMAVGDKTAFNKVITGLTQKQLLTRNGEYYQLGTSGGHGFVIQITGDNLFIALDADLLKAYQTSTTKSALPGDIEKETSNKSMALYVDIAELLKNSQQDSAANISMNRKNFQYSKTNEAARETFKNFIATTDKGDGKIIKGNLELNFVNANENSLASLAKFLTIARSEQMKRDTGWTAYPPSLNLHDTDSLQEK